MPDDNPEAEIGMRQMGEPPTAPGATVAVYDATRAELHRQATPPGALRSAEDLFAPFEAEAPAGRVSMLVGSSPKDAMAWVVLRDNTTGALAFVHTL